MTADIAQRANSSEMVRRSYDIADFEFRDQTADGGGFTFEGVASVVDKPYTVRDRWGEFTETIRAGAFNHTLRDSKADVGLLVSHRGDPIANRLSGTLRLTADPDLRVEAQLDPADPEVQSVRSKVSRGIMRQMSIGFTVPKARDEWSEDMTQRTIHQVALREASIVWQGANPHTSGAMRSFDEFMETLTDVEMSDEEVHRAIAHLTAMLTPDPVVEEIINEYAERDRAERAHYERKALLRRGLVAA